MKCIGGPLHGQDYQLRPGASHLHIPIEHTNRHPKQWNWWITDGVYERRRVVSKTRGEYEYLQFVFGYYYPPEYYGG